MDRERCLAIIIHVRNIYQGVLTVFIAGILSCSAVVGDTVSVHETLREALEFQGPKFGGFDPVYPRQDQSMVARFRARVHHDFSEIAKSDSLDDSMKTIQEYIDIRDDLIGRDSLVSFALAGYITMAVDAFLVQEVFEAPESKKQLDQLAEENHIAPERLFSALDAGFKELGREYESLASFCKSEDISPKSDCWTSYMSQFSLRYAELEVFDVTARFLDGPFRAFRKDLARLGALEEHTRNPVFVLHSGRDDFLVLFAVGVLDAERIRQTVWRIAGEGVLVDPEKNVHQIAKLLNGVGPSGGRWFLNEYQCSDMKSDVEGFLTKCKFISRFSRFDREVDLEDWKELRMCLKISVGQARN